MGLSPARVKLFAFAVSGGLAGVAGGLLVGLLVQFTPEQFTATASLQVVAVAVVGGLASITGTVLGSLFIVGLPAFFPDSPEVALLTSGIGMLVLLLYFPGGLVQILFNARDAALAARMEERASTVKAAFAREFVTPSGRLVYDDQTSYALAILHDLIPAELLPAAAGYFKARIAWSDNCIGTGFIGTPALLPALVKIGEPELAAAVFLQERIPGWLYQVKTGATTIWERWDAIGEDGKAFDPTMNSYNHYAYGAVCQWLFEVVAGFRPDPDRPGFRHVIFEPLIVPSLSPVRAHHDSMAGRIGAAWTVAGDAVTYEVAIPEGASGTLVLSPRYSDIAVDGVPLPAPDGSEKTRGLLAPGTHTITFRISRQ